MVPNNAQVLAARGGAKGVDRRTEEEVGDRAQRVPVDHSRGEDRHDWLEATKGELREVARTAGEGH